MVELDAVWLCPRTVKVNGKDQRVPFGVALDPSLVAFMTRWIRGSGTQFAAKRVKALKVWAIHVLAGERDYSEPWFSKIHYKGYLIPKLKLFEYLLDHKDNVKVVRLILVVLNSYKLVVIGRPSLDSVRCVTTKPAGEYVRLLRYYVSLPHVPQTCLETTEAVDTRKSWADDFGRTHPGPYGLRDQRVSGFYDMNLSAQSLGVLVPIVDKGKYRNILVGHWLLQLKTKKLADWLRQWLWDLPEIASGDQNKMGTFIIGALNQGQYMMSIDLSEATDRLSRDLQVQLLISMGVPEAYFRYFNLPFHYRGANFGEEDKIKEARYRNGQPMGLFLSFPMFELAHYVIAKYAVATCKATFCMCGDDIVLALENASDRDKVFGRYKTLIERFGGVISSAKTIMSSKLAEGIGAIFLKGIQKEIRIPSGKVSIQEALCPGTWLYERIVHRTPLGRALMRSWLSTRLTSEYTYEQRTSMNELLVSLDLSTWDIQALRSLDKAEHMPQTVYRFDDLPAFWRNTPEDEEVQRFKWIGLRAYMESLVSNKIVSLYRNDTKGI